MGKQELIGEVESNETSCQKDSQGKERNRNIDGGWKCKTALEG